MFLLAWYDPEMADLDTGNLETAWSVSWTRMEEGDAADYAKLGKLYTEHAAASVVENLVDNLKRLRGPKLGYQIDRYQHSLQSATRALNNGESAEMVVAALFHDVGDVLAPDNHSQVAAAILAPYVSEEITWVVRHHGVFQGYYYFHHVGLDRNAREQFSESPFYDRCVDFCANYDQNCFDPKHDDLALEDFLPIVREVFSGPTRLVGEAGA